ncbi:peptidase [candidate division MSBL1 archaeon SCGC-AAA259D14]|uniref:Peptidase n=1 Tax=candidate division MSBL1 archaeon SCGC-AAA259D14 TaxID=1698261 RepID=A0A133U3H4_9EURY|nr:peptidase [candidate division MSBL1 archaeon SCGC-AAA259D14]
MEKKVFSETREALEKLGLPGSDLYELPTSEQTFPDGCQYRIEVPTINSDQAMESLLKTSEKLDLVINRIDETRGIMRHTDEEIESMVELAQSYELELNMSHGPRAKYDTSATWRTEMGSWVAYRLRGVEQIVRAVEDIKRAIEFGVRGFLVYDVGFLWVLDQLRADEYIPKSTRFKLSAHCGHGNPASFKVLSDLGADSVNPTRDLQLPMIAALRQTVDIPIDVHCDNPPSSGGFIRTLEAPEMARIGAPIHLKCGNSAVTSHGIPTTSEEGVEMAKQAHLVQQAVERYYPEAKQSEPGAEDQAIPV